MPRAAVFSAICLTIAVAGAATAQTADPGARRATPARPADAMTDDDRDLLRQLADAQKWAGEQIWAAKEVVDALPGAIAEVKDQIGAGEDEMRKVRDEVKGLYVEMASLREQLEAARADVAGVNANLSSFRTFSGFFIAAMILLLALVAVMTIRR